MSNIHLKVYVTKKIRTPPISVVYGSTGVGIEMEIMDYDLPKGSTAEARATGKFATAVYKNPCTVDGNTITMYPETGFFVPGGNELQVVITAAGKTILSFVMDAICDKDIGDGNDPAKPEQVLPLVKRAENAATQSEAAAARAEEVKDSIPADYTELIDGVIQLKNDLAEIDTIISPFLPVPAHIGVNKCDPSKFTDGWIDANGNWTDKIGMLTTDYIDISGFESGFLSAYCCLKSGVPYNNLGMFSCCFFSDADGSVVPGGNRGAHNTIDTCAIAIPDGAKYARVSFNTASIIFSYMIIDQHVTGAADALNYTKYEVIPATDGEKIASENDVFCWKGKTWLSYGDSITAIGNGNPADAWQQYVTDRLKFGTQIVRGIGGSTYKYKVIPAFINADGSFHSRADGASMLDPSSYTVPEGTTAHWSYMASWDRITAMIPDDIKDSIDLIFTFGVNDSGWMESDVFEPPVFSASNTTDAFWMNAAENTIGGDYDVNKFIDSWASCIMKLQKRCPNALIVCGTGWSGRGSTDNTDSGEYNISSQNVWKEGRLVQQIANYFSVPCIDIWGNTQVNPWNRSLYNADVIHPYKDAGKKALARAVIDGLAQIHPRMDVE